MQTPEVYGIKPTLAWTDPFARDQFKGATAHQFKMKVSAPLTLLLGMQVIRDHNARTVEIRQTAYIDQLLQKLSMTEYKPAVSNHPRSAQSLVGCMLCAAPVTRPGIA